MLFSAFLRELVDAGLSGDALVAAFERIEKHGKLPAHPRRERQKIVYARTEVPTAAELTARGRRAREAGLHGR